jgi:hypothetical protein
VPGVFKVGLCPVANDGCVVEESLKEGKSQGVKVKVKVTVRVRYSRY